MIVSVVNIGSGAVSLALVRLEKGKAPLITYSAIREFQFQSKLDPQLLLTQSLNALRIAVTEMQKKTPDAPSAIFCLLPAHLIASQTRTIELDFQKPTEINEAIINAAIDKELEDNKLKDIVDKKIIHVRLNGYETANLKNRISSHVQISVSYNVADSDTVVKIRSMLASLFHNDQIQFHSFSSACFAVVRDLSAENNDFIFAEIGAEITDVLSVKDGVLDKTTSFPIGKNSIIRFLIDKTGGNYGLVMSAIRSNDKNDGNLSAAGVMWRSAFCDAFGGGGNLLNRIPQKIFILSDKETSGIFKSSIDKADVLDLNATVLRKFCDNISRSAEDPSVMISSIFVNKLLN